MTEDRNIFDADGQEQTDLFSAEISTDSGSAPEVSEVAPEAVPEESGSAGPAPETQPLIGKKTPPPDPVPLVFSESSPVPMRAGEKNRIHVPDELPGDRFRKFVPLDAADVPDNATTGQILQRARNAAGYSLDEVIRTTFISRQYVEALENDEPDKLPPPVYVSAYLRTLAGLYHLPAGLLERLRKLSLGSSAGSDVSPEFVQHINEEGHLNEEEEKRIKRIFLCVGIGVSVAILFGIWAQIAAIVHAMPDRPVSAGVAVTDHSLIPTSSIPFDADRFKALNAEPVCDLYTLEISTSPEVRRK